MLSWVPGLLIAINCVSNDIAEIGKTRKKMTGVMHKGIYCIKSNTKELIIKFTHKTPFVLFSFLFYSPLGLY